MKTRKEMAIGWTFQKDWEEIREEEGNEVKVRKFIITSSASYPEGRTQIENAENDD
jgi:hypothetical protein